MEKKERAGVRTTNNYTCLTLIVTLIDDSFAALFKGNVDVEEYKRAWNL